MDPEQALKDAQLALDEGELDDLRDALDAYGHWRARGGFEPASGDARERELRAWLERVGGGEPDPDAQRDAALDREWDEAERECGERDEDDEDDERGPLDEDYDHERRSEDGRR